jgi:hypothetical protein
MTRRLGWWSLAVVVHASFAWAQGTPPAAATPAVEAPAPTTPPPPSLPPPPPSTEPAAAPVAVPAPAVAPPVTGRDAVAPAEVVSDRSFGVHVAVNLGLFAVDLQQGHFYGFAAANAGVPLVSNGSVGAFAIGLGYSTPLSRPEESMWFMDFFVDALPGWWGQGGSIAPVVGVGAGLGFRFLHRSGFTAGFKIPVFGASFSSMSGFSTSQSVGMYYLFSLIALPIVSFGYRF